MRQATLFFAAFAAFATACTSVASVPAKSAGDRVQREVAGAVLLVRTPRHVRVAIDTAFEMGKQDPRFQQFRVLVCGEAVQALKAGGELEPLLRSAREQQIRVSACGLSLKELAIDPATITDTVEIIPNALSEVLRMQADGWISVEL